MKGNRPNAIPHQIHVSPMTAIDVVGSEEVRAEVSSERDCNHKTGNSEIFPVAHGVEQPNGPSF